MAIIDGRRTRRWLSPRPCSPRTSRGCGHLHTYRHPHAIALVGAVPHEAAARDPPMRGQAGATSGRHGGRRRVCVCWRLGLTRAPRRICARVRHECLLCLPRLLLLMGHVARVYLSESSECGSVSGAMRWGSGVLNPSHLYYNYNTISHQHGFDVECLLVDPSLVKLGFLSDMHRGNPVLYECACWCHIIFTHT